jgi:tryptophanyl-tRNA synthetase
MFADRVLSGMRPTGRMHLGHYHGVLKNWVRLQEEYECLYFAADWHALTTHYDVPETIAESVWEMFVDWLAVGINPTRATIFIQSRVPEHAELALLLGMIAPIGWLERVPTYKDQQEKLADRDLSTFGFLGYPVMQGADILVYRANMVPVGEDQVPHLEIVRELARRFNHLYGREPGFEDKAKAAIKKLGSKRAKRYEQLRTAFQEKGDQAALEAAREMLDEAQNLALGDRERLFGYLEESHRMILPEPQPLLTETTRVPGVDGQRRRRSPKRTAPCRTTRRACTARIQARRKNAPCGRCTRSIRTKRSRPGCRTAAPPPASAASSASSR